MTLKQYLNKPEPSFKFKGREFMEFGCLVEATAEFIGKTEIAKGIIKGPEGFVFLFYSVIAKLSIRLEKKIIGRDIKLPVKFKFTHIESIALIAIFSYPQIKNLWAKSPFNTMIINAVINELQKTYL